MSSRRFWIGQKQDDDDDDDKEREDDRRTELEKGRDASSKWRIEMQWVWPERSSASEYKDRRMETKSPESKRAVRWKEREQQHNAGWRKGSGG